MMAPWKVSGPPLLVAADLSQIANLLHKINTFQPKMPNRDNFDHMTINFIDVLKNRIYIIVK
jgi:hypothetical protein